MLKAKSFFLCALLAFTCIFVENVYSDITWSSPVAISSTGVDATDPCVVIDSNNNVTAVWVENSIIKSSSLPSGGSWSAIVSLSDALNTSASPKLGIDASGNVTALWIENSQMTSATLPFGGSWTTSTTISNMGVSKPSLAVDASGNAVAVWERSGYIESSTRISGSWSLISVLSSSSSSNPHVAISNFGVAYAVWHSVISGVDVIVSDVLTISSNTWDLTNNVFTASSGTLQNYPKAAIDMNGNAKVAWFSYKVLDGNAYQNVQVVVSSLTQGSTSWTAPTVLSYAGIRDPSELTIILKFDQNGNAIAVWTNSYDGQNFTIESSQKLFGAPGWLNFISADIPTLYSFGIDLAHISSTALLTYMVWDGSSNISIVSQETDTAQPILSFWSVSNVFSTGSYNAYPQCSITLTGDVINAVAIWIHYNGSNKVIHTSIGSELEVTAPSSVSVSQSSTDFGVYTDYYNTITWSASSDPDIVQYNIFRDGVFFASTDASTFSFVDHNRVQNGSVTYGVAALNSTFRQSDVISYNPFP